MKTRVQLILLLLTALPLLCNGGKVYGQQTQSTELQFYFKVGRFNIDPDYMSNRITLNRLSEIVTQDNAQYVESLVINGYASPDGSSAINERLATERARAVKQYLTANYPYLQPDKITASGKGVNWDKLRELIVADKSVPNREKVLYIIDNVPAEIDYKTATSRKKSLMELGVPTWNYMLHNQFPLLRVGASVAVTLIVKTPQETNAEVDGINGKPDDIKEQLPAVQEEVAVTPAPPLPIEPDRKSRLALKTNLLYGAYAFTPNLAMEIGLGKHTTLDIAGGYNWFNRDGKRNNNKKRVHWLVQPEFRYFLRECFDGHFFGVHALYSQYNIGGHNLPMLFGKGSKAYRHEGSAAGAGVSYGYQLVLGRSWNLEFNVGVGYAQLQYDKYACANCGKKTGNETKHYFGPTKAGISLIWMIK